MAFLVASGRIVLIDDRDLETLAPKRWIFHHGYIQFATGRTTMLLHRVVMNAPKGIQIDHINGNPLDNRRENLRFCNPSQNRANSRRSPKNTSGFKGVHWDRKWGRWVSMIRVNGKKIYLGSSDDPAKAHKLYCEAAKEHFGEFANFGMSKP
jgi:hypothetical protein